MESPTDTVEVAFVHKGQTFETRRCARSKAHLVGRRMVEGYSPLIHGTYVIKDEKPVVHHFEIVK